MMINPAFGLCTSCFVTVTRIANICANTPTCLTSLSGISPPARRTGHPALPDCPRRKSKRSRNSTSFLNTTFTETPGSRKREQRPTVLIHPADCEQLRIASGDRVKIGNQRGEIVVHAKAFDGLQRGVLVVESIWPNSDFETGVGDNALIGADPGPPNGGAVFHDSAVWVKRATQP